MTTKLNELRSELVNKGLVFFAFTGPLAILLSVARSTSQGWQPIFTFHIIIGIVLILSASFRKRLPYTFRKTVLQVIPLIAGIAGLLAYGLVGGGLLILCVFALITALTSGVKSALYACGINGTILAVVSYCVCNGILIIPIDVADYSTSAPAWITMFSIFFAFIPTIILAFSVLQKELANALDEQHEKNETMVRLQKELLSHQDHLEDKVKKRTKELEESQKELLEYANVAGKAEIATGVLHNIGNILTSASIHTEQLHSNLKSEKYPEQLVAINELLQQHSDDIISFFSRDPKGKKVLRYIKEFPETLVHAHKKNQQSLSDLTSSLALIKDSVALQQAYALQGDFETEVLLSSEIDRVLSIENISLTKYKIETNLHFDIDPTLKINRSKFANTIMNIIKNAKESMLIYKQSELLLSIRIQINDANELEIHFSDTGSGIEADNITRIFTYGFTTKDDGHGFGLHQSANDIQSMGGSLTASSKGIGFGSTFTITLPASRILT